MNWGVLARSTGGRLMHGAPDAGVPAISTDTRTITAGQVFWALKGPRFDAHDHLDRALASRSAGWVVEKGRLPADSPLPNHVVEVAHTLKALQTLAANHRRRFTIPIVAITGSNGKTTTKDMLGSICRRSGETCISPGNFNNEIGVPLSLLELRASHRYGIFELGASHPGDIAKIARIAQPTVGILTNISAAHLEFFGTVEETFKTKSALLDFLPPDGPVAYNTDDPWLSKLADKLGSRGIPFGADPRARIRIVPPGTLIIDGKKTPIELRSFGSLSLYNAAAAAAGACALGIAPETIRAGLEEHEPGSQRLERLRHPSGCEFVLDAYNANPASMRAAISGFCEAFSATERILVLGDMKELGDSALKLHSELGTWLAGLPLKRVYLAGRHMEFAARALKLSSSPFPVRFSLDAGEWIEELKSDIKPGRAVMIKASRAMKFESLLAGLGLPGGR